MLIISSGFRKANKDHVCDFCANVIKKGDKYSYQNNKYDGEMYTWKTHVECEFIAGHYDMYKDCSDEGLNGDDFQDLVSDIFNDISLSEKIQYLYKLASQDGEPES